MVAGIFADLLQIPRAGAEDSFFDLGGHSLLAAQLVSRLRESFGVDLPLRLIFERPTVRALSESLEVMRNEEQGLERPPLARTPRARGSCRSPSPSSASGSSTSSSRTARSTTCRWRCASKGRWPPRCWRSASERSRAVTRPCARSSPCGMARRCN